MTDLRIGPNHTTGTSFETTTLPGDQNSGTVAGTEGDSYDAAGIPGQGNDFLPTDSPVLVSANPRHLRARVTAQIQNEMAIHQPFYSIDQLQLGQLEDNALLALSNQVRQGQVPVGDAIEAVQTLQQYFGYNNAQTASAVREIYYQSVLDPFTAGADQVTGAIHSNISGERNGVSASDAAHARALLMLSSVTRPRADGSKRDPVIEIVAPPGGLGVIPAGEDIGFDHVIAGIDGHLHPIRGGTERPELDEVVRFLGGDPARLRSEHANTWLGDVVATVLPALEQNSGSFDGPADSNSTLANLGWDREFAPQDQFGDRLGVIINPDPDGDNLASYLWQGLSGGGIIYEDRFRRFASELGLRFDGQGNITNRDAWVEQNLNEASALAVAFFHFKNKPGSLVELIGRGAANPVFGGVDGAIIELNEELDLARDVARINLDRWVGHIQSGLRNELAD